MKPTNPLKQMPSLRELDKQNKHIHLMLSLTMIVLSALGQTFVMQVFMDPCNLISGGFTGIALFMQKVLARIGIPFSTSVGILVLNVPAAIWAYKRISKRFVMLTAIQFTLVSLFLERIGIPFSTSVGILVLNVPAAIWAYKRISKRFVMLTAIQFTLVSLFLETFTFTPLVEDKVLNILFGGIGWGFTIALALRAGGSTGGTDFIAQYVSTAPAELTLLHSMSAQSCTKAFLNTSFMPTVSCMFCMASLLAGWQRGIRSCFSSCQQNPYLRCISGTHRSRCSSRLRIRIRLRMLSLPSVIMACPSLTQPGPIPAGGIISVRP